MAYSDAEKARIYEQAKSVIERDDNILFIDDVVSELPISKPTFYSWWPEGSAEYNELWERIKDNRVKVKKYIRLKLRVSGKAAELLSLYRMICTEEERKNINQHYVEMSGSLDTDIKVGFVETDVQPKASEDDVDAEP